MKLKMITGKQGADILAFCKNFECKIVEFPETKICHPYDLCEHVMRMIQDHYESDSDLIILTYSEVVFDAIRLWVARNQFENTECIFVLKDGKCITSSIDRYGEMEKWVDGVFDTKRIVLKELFEIRDKSSNN